MKRHVKWEQGNARAHWTLALAMSAGLPIVEYLMGIPVSFCAGVSFFGNSTATSRTDAHACTHAHNLSRSIDLSIYPYTLRWSIPMSEHCIFDDALLHNLFSVHRCNFLRPIWITRMLIDSSNFQIQSCLVRGRVVHPCCSEMWGMKTNWSNAATEVQLWNTYHCLSLPLWLTLTRPPSELRTNIQEQNT